MINSTIHIFKQDFTNESYLSTIQPYTCLFILWWHFITYAISTKISVLKTSILIIKSVILLGKFWSQFFINEWINFLLSFFSFRKYFNFL